MFGFKKRLIIALAFILSLALLLVPACAAPAVEEEGLQPVTIKISADVPAAPHPKGQAMAEFKELVEERIPGSEVRVYYGGMLFSDPDACEALIAGTLEICWAQGGKIAGIEKRIGATELPSLWSTREDLVALDNSQLMAYLSGLLEAKGILWMGMGHTNPYTGIACGTRITDPASWAGKIIRTTSAAAIYQFELTGCSSLVMPFSEVASALATGVIDGCYTSTTAWRTFAEVAPYFTSVGIAGIGVAFYPFLVSKKWWDTLNTETQEVLTECIDEIVEREKDLAFLSGAVITDEYGVDDPTEEGYWNAPLELQEEYKELWVPSCYDYHRDDWGDEVVDLAVLFALEKK